MTKDQAKLFLPIITAFAEGKTIQMKGADDKWQVSVNPGFTRNPEDYRIKPELKYRPFKNLEECWAEMQKHQPFGWVKFKGEETSYMHCQAIEDRGVLYNSDAQTFEYMLNDFTFIDGSPFGILDNIF